jgi:hypothetical protein
MHATPNLRTLQYGHPMAIAYNVANRGARPAWPKWVDAVLRRLCMRVQSCVLSGRG